MPLTLLMVCAAFVMAACGASDGSNGESSDVDQIRAVIARVNDAGRELDAEGVCRATVPPAREHALRACVTSTGQQMRHAPGPWPPTKLIGPVCVNGDSARAAVKSGLGRHYQEFVRRQGKWYWQVTEITQLKGHIEPCIRNAAGTTRTTTITAP
jgi:hypothetical protein